ncbi:hypothetical protein [Evansella clarkii]|nr:hypothetical protein [Evansella clarkii]
MKEGLPLAIWLPILEISRSILENKGPFLEIRTPILEGMPACYYR